MINNQWKRLWKLPLDCMCPITYWISYWTRQQDKWYKMPHTLKPDFCERGEPKKKKNTHQDIIHSLVLQSLQFKFTAILLCARHHSAFMYQSFQSASTLTFELTMGMSIRDRQKPNLSYFPLSRSWFKHKTATWGYFCTRKEMNIHASLVYLSEQSSSKRVSN